MADSEDACRKRPVRGNGLSPPVARFELKFNLTSCPKRADPRAH